MTVTPEQAYAMACRLLGERDVQIAFMSQALAEAQKHIAELNEKLKPADPQPA